MSFLTKLIQLKTPIKKIFKLATYESGTLSDSDGNPILERTVSAVRVALVEPATTFTSATPSSAAAGADTLLTSAGAHGLTGAVSVGASIYISAGTGWTVGFHAITAIAVDTTGTTIQIDTPYSASMGTPTIALANTEVTVATIAIPALSENGYIAIDWTYAWTSSSNTKSFRVKFGGVAFVTAQFTTSISARTSVLIANRGVTNSQIGAVNTGTGFGNTTVATSIGAVDSSTIQNLLLTLQPSVANEVVANDRYIVEVWR